MSRNWYARPVLNVRFTPIALQFYTSKLGFREDWRSEEESQLRIVQVSREGCEVILTDQWPEETGRGRIFISLDIAGFAALNQEFAANSVEVKTGWWGYDLLTVEDPDGNRLWFPSPAG